MFSQVVSSSQACGDVPVKPNMMNEIMPMEGPEDPALQAPAEPAPDAAAADAAEMRWYGAAAAAGAAAGGEPAAESPGGGGNLDEGVSLKDAVSEVVVGLASRRKQSGKGMTVTIGPLRHGADSVLARDR